MACPLANTEPDDLIEWSMVELCDYIESEEQFDRYLALTRDLVLTAFSTWTEF